MGGPIRRVIKRFGVVRTIEIAAILVGLIIVGYDFLIEKPRDRAVRYATLVNQIAVARESPSEEIRRSAAITIATLGREGFPLLDINMSGMDFSGLDMRGSDFRGADLSKAIFIGANLSFSDFTGANLADAVFYATDASFSRFQSSSLQDATIVFSKLNFSRFEIPPNPGNKFLYNQVSGSYLLFELERKFGLPLNPDKMNPPLSKALCAKSVYPSFNLKFKNLKNNAQIFQCNSSLERSITIFGTPRFSSRKVTGRLIPRHEIASKWAQSIAVSRLEAHKEDEKKEVPIVLPDWFPLKDALEIKFLLIELYYF